MMRAESTRKRAAVALLVGILASTVSAQVVDKPEKAGPAKKEAAAPEKAAAAGQEVRLTYRKGDSHDEYVGATMSFEFATRDDWKRIKNDWDICLQGWGIERNPYHFECRTVTDDRSELWDVGAVPLEKVTMKSIVGASAPYCVASHAGRLVHDGHSYVVHTVDGDSDLWAKFQVTEVVPESHVVIRWELLGEPKKIAPPKR